jgi:carbamoyl-phosphate synthase large subunit
MRHSDKPAIVPIAKKIIALGFNILATRGTAKILEENYRPDQVNRFENKSPRHVRAAQIGRPPPNVWKNNPPDAIRT